MKEVSQLEQGESSIEALIMARCERMQAAHFGFWKRSSTKASIHCAFGAQNALRMLHTLSFGEEVESEMTRHLYECIKHHRTQPEHLR